MAEERRKGPLVALPMLAAGAYVLVTLVAYVTVFGSVLGARATGHDERLDVAGLQIKNFREVDDRLLAGAQPTGDAFERLGHAPDAEMIERFLAVMEQSKGRVYLHCGGGVGRSTSFEMAYRAATGLDYGVPAQLAIGPRRSSRCTSSPGSAATGRRASAGRSFTPAASSTHHVRC